MTNTPSHIKTANGVIPQAIIVSHGQPSDPDIAEVELAHLAQNVGAHLMGWTVHSATLAAPNALETALQKAGQRPLIYPLFMTDGWFTQSALPNRIHAPDAQVLPPLGVDPSLLDLAQTWLEQVISAQNWRSDQTTLIIAAHGSGRSRNPARDTRRFADALRQRLPFFDMRLGFVEEKPDLHDALSDVGAQSLVLPFFASKRGHVLEDLPAAMSAAQFQGICLEPIGLHPAVPSLIADALIHEALQT